MKTTLHYDERWQGQDGISRFSKEILTRVDNTLALNAVHIAAEKLSALDPLATLWAMRGLERGVYFTPGFNPPLYCPLPFVFGLYDLILLRFPLESRAKHRAYFRLVVRPGARRAHSVLTISEHSRNGILEWCGLSPERVVNVGCGVANAFHAQGPVYAPGYPYFLFVGRRTPHKNVGALLKAYATSRSRREVKLVFAGRPDAETTAAAEKLGLAGDVIFSDASSDARLAELYRGAVALAWPSLYEGFGLPIAEAMACGTPVITSNVTAMPETAGQDNAILVDPTRVEDISDALDRVSSDSQLQSRLRKRGLLRASAFSWDTVAAAALEVFMRAAIEER